MDAMTSALTLLLLAVGGVAMAMRSSAGATMVIGHLFYVPERAWPAGVQEDDDLHWSWAPARPPAPATSSAIAVAGDLVPIESPGPDSAEVIDNASSVRTTPVRGLISRR